MGCITSKSDTSRSAGPPRSEAKQKEPPARFVSEFADESKAAGISTRACFGAGCYWGTENYFMHKFSHPSGRILKGKVGFMGSPGAKANPSYREVCSGTTGHVEVYDLQFEGDEQFYEALCRFFFQFHDPTTMNQQGNDRGTQYASVTYCYDKKQMEVAQKVKSELQNLVNTGKVTGFKQRNISTDIRAATTFYPAHAGHQNYLVDNPGGYCNHRIRFKEWPSV